MYAWKNTAVCLVKHSHDTNKNTREDYETITLSEIFSMADEPHPDCEKKDAPSVIFSTYHVYDARERDAQTRDGNYVALWADLDKDDHPLAKVVSVVKSVAETDHAWAIFSTYSATKEEPRWRIIIPLANALNFPRWTIAQQALSARLESQGIITDATAKRA